MDKKFHQKNVFESGFDSFEFDDGFLMNVDADLEKNKINGKQCGTKKYNSWSGNKDEDKEKKISEMKIDPYDLPLFIEDLDESDFFDFTWNKKKNYSSKVVTGPKNNGSLTDNSTGWLSPIEGPKRTDRSNLSSSTPVKPGKDSENVTGKNFDYAYLDADLFEDWNPSEGPKESPRGKTVTLTQALKLIEEAESGRESPNRSVDLLTGQIVGLDTGIAFEESFHLGKSPERDSSNDSVVILEERKPPAAQKLNFESDKSATGKESGGICFSSDDDFDFLTQDLLENGKGTFEPARSRSPDPEKTGTSDPNDSMDAVVRFKKKRGKCLQVIESDGTDDSPNPKFRKGRRKQADAAAEFLETEAEVSDVAEVSSDETEEEGEYERSFLDEESYFSQNQSANMTTKYLESVKGVARPGNFKIPAAKPYDPNYVFSQEPEESNTDYILDSFCVNDVDEEAKTDLSDLEVAEKILEMDRKKRKRKRCQKVRK